MTLYEISDSYQFLLHGMYNHETGEVDENVLARLNELADSAENKCINIVKISEEFKKEIAAIADAKARMSKREKAFKNQVDRLKSYLQDNMERCEITKISCPEFVISLQNNPASLQVDDESLVDPEFLVTTVSVNTAKLKEALKKGLEVPYARLVQGQSVRIR
jgi:hypothetical protein